MRPVISQFKPIGWSILVTLILSLLLSGAAAALASAGILPVAAMPAFACGITVISAFCGAAVCGLQVKAARLPLCMAGGIVYLLLVFVMRGLIFRSVGENLWSIPVCVLLSAMAGAVVTSVKKRR